ncbi:hypothetical protein [Sinimarinibacterium thermocellulolyticum]|uniref:Uncharacterized protein n=1 Tax=Sinimarinibacterium thermocellulolyticum TaxID=3170016 RepID=A0ABV2A5V3_9GAMM
MQIKIEIDVRPEELRRFLGLPDVSALPADVVGFVRELAGAASEFDAANFVKTNLGTLRKNPALQKLVARIRIADAEEPAEGATRTRRKGMAATNRRRRKREDDAAP